MSVTYFDTQVPAAPLHSLPLLQRAWAALTPASIHFSGVIPQGCSRFMLQK